MAHSRPTVLIAIDPNCIKGYNLSHWRDFSAHVSTLKASQKETEIRVIAIDTALEAGPKHDSLATIFQPHMLGIEDHGYAVNYSMPEERSIWRTDGKESECESEQVSMMLHGPLLPPDFFKACRETPCATTIMKLNQQAFPDEWKLTMLQNYARAHAIPEQNIMVIDSFEAFCDLTEESGMTSIYADTPHVWKAKRQPPTERTVKNCKNVLVDMLSSIEKERIVPGAGAEFPTLATSNHSFAVTKKGQRRRLCQQSATPPF